MTDSETMAFANALDMPFIVRNKIEKMMKRNTSILMFTDSLSISDVITEDSSTEGKRIIINLEVVKTAYWPEDIEKTVLIRSKFTLPDYLSKGNSNDSLVFTMKKAALLYLVDH